MTNTEGNTLEEAMRMSKEALELHLCGMEDDKKMMEHTETHAGLEELWFDGKRKI